MIKILWIVMISIMSVGCASVRMTEYHDKQFTMCGNRWADASDWMEAEINACSGGAERIAGYTQYVSSGRTTISQQFGMINVQEHGRNETCRVYNCLGHVIF
jgi:hypothetical protein